MGRAGEGADRPACSVAGWVSRVRELKNVAFVVLRDASGHIQLVATEAHEIDVATSLAPRR